MKDKLRSDCGGSGQ